ncbi:MAG TPA: AI-2E family transporter [Longimicrobiaceae bacterium]|nr:AI-2E family transporter [Longimicrobiaceae bacterium]
MRLRNLESRVFVVLVLATTAFFLWMVRGFLLPVFWAAVFAVLFQPLFVRLEDRLRGRRSLAALLTTLSVILVVLIPFGLLVTAVAQQALSLYQRITAGEVNLYAPIAFVERWLPTLSRTLAGYGIEIERLRASVQSAAVAGTQYIATHALALGQNILAVAVLFGLMLYFLFFFFRDGDRILRGIIRALPMGDEREKRLLRKFAEVSRATVKGTLVVAAVQGTVGGVLFWLVGIQAAVFWGVAMGILSLVPAIGSALVWVPAAVILFATGAIWQGIVVVVGGTVVIGLVDNVLRPVLVGRETQMPDYLVLLATLGGLTVFGLAGFVAGPIVAALFLVMWDMFADEFAPLDSSEIPAAPTTPSDPVPQPAPVEVEVDGARAS